MDIYANITTICSINYKIKGMTLIRATNYRKLCIGIRNMEALSNTLAWVFY